MATLRENLLPTMHTVRAISGKLGFRPSRVFIDVTEFTGIANMGESVASDPVTTELTHADGYGVKVSLVTTEEVVSSAGQVVATDLRIGPLTPAFDDGGVSLDTLYPPYPGENVSQEVVVRIEGDGIPEGARFSILSVDTFGNLSYFLTVRKLS